MEDSKKVFGLSGNMLKIIAAVSMFIDHFGLILFPRVRIFRIIGRLAFPIFAFLIAEGARYTKHKGRYFIQLLSLGLVCTAVQFAAQGRLYFNVLITFSFAVLAVFSLQEIKKALVLNQKLIKVIAFTAIFLLVLTAAYALDYFFALDYGFTGVLVVVAAALFHSVDGQKEGLFKSLDNKFTSVLAMIIPMLLISFTWDIQPFSFIALPLLFLYSGKRGKCKMKYFFYVFYPLHITILYGVDLFFF